MDALIALSHFCESHGPCVILCTQRCKEEPQQPLHSLTVPWCESCQSIQLDQALSCKGDNVYFVSTRTPLKQDLAFLLKQAAVRILSCEEESGKDGGVLYFGDNERGHVISHTFTLQDSLARGFHRKYSILLLMRDKIHLLNNWSSLTNKMKQISADLKQKAAKINNVEQSQCPQRAVREAQGSPGTQARSLSELTGEPAVFAHLHMWFTWILNCEEIREKPAFVPQVPISCSAPILLRNLSQEMDDTTFRTVCYCVLTGIPLLLDDTEILNAFRQLLPSNFNVPTTGQACNLTKVNDAWKVAWNGTLPLKLPTLLVQCEKTLISEFPESALQSFLESRVLHWLNVAKSVSWTPNPDAGLFQSLGVSKCDMPLLSYWISNCK